MESGRNAISVELAVAGQVSESSEGQDKDDRIKENREGGEGGDVEGVCAPRLLSKKLISKIQHRGWITDRMTYPSVTRLV